MKEQTLFQKFSLEILRIVGEKPTKTREILKIIKERYPKECDDTIRCIHKGIDYGRPEWEHILRSAQQALKRKGLTELDKKTKQWFLKEQKKRIIVMENELIRELEEISDIPITDEEIEEIVGESMDLGVLRWTPTTHDGVVVLFVEYREPLGFPIIEWIRPQFPDACVWQKLSKNKHIKRYVEFELFSSYYKEHTINPKHRMKKCHYVVCWEHDWQDCPIPNIELKTEIPKIRSTHFLKSKYETI